MNKQVIQFALDLAVAIAALASVWFTIDQIQGTADDTIVIGNWLAWGVFLLNYVVGIALADDRRQYERQNMLNLAVVILTFPILTSFFVAIQFIRLLPLVVILRLFLISWQGLRGLRTALGRTGLLYLAAANSVLIIGGAVLLWILEPETLPEGPLEGIYWAIVTMATVGYGDIVPVTPAGRTLAVVMIIGGVGLLSTLTASIASYWVRADRGMNGTNTKEQLDRIEARIDELTQLVQSQSAPLKDNPPGKK